MAKSEDHDQTGPLGAVSSVSALSVRKVLIITVCCSSSLRWELGTKSREFFFLQNYASHRSIDSKEVDQNADVICWAEYLLGLFVCVGLLCLLLFNYISYLFSGAIKTTFRLVSMAEIESCIKSFLKSAKDRDGGRQRRMKIRNTSVNNCNREGVQSGSDSDM